MKRTLGSHSVRNCVVYALIGLLAAGPLPAIAQTRPVGDPAAAAQTRPAGAESDWARLSGRTIEEIRIIGKSQSLSTITEAEVRRQIRSRAGERFDPSTVEGDYQRVYSLKRFSNIEARVEPTTTGVIVVFDITEQKQVRDIRFLGNRKIGSADLELLIELRRGEAIDTFRLGLAREAIERHYQGKNHTFARVEVDANELKDGNVVFRITEGPSVVVRKVAVEGNRYYSTWKIKDQVKTSSWFPVFAAGRLDFDQIEQDVAAIRRFYEDRGFFDARVGRRIDYNKDQSEVMVTFVIDEGSRYMVDRIIFRGNATVTEAALRKDLVMTPGRYYDQDGVRRDLRTMVRVYSPLGYIYQPPPNPQRDEYLRIDPQSVFRRSPGKVDIVYDIREGRPFLMGRLLVKGNEKTLDKVIQREFRVAPGSLYNSAAIQEAVDRLKSLGLFADVRVTPIGNDPDARDVLVEVTETNTAKLYFGAGVTSSAGIIGNITYEQRNFDIGATPTDWSDWSKGRAFTGAGQLLRINLAPGTELSAASIDFVEPWLFDQPYSLGLGAFLSTRVREDYDEIRTGGKVFLGKRFGPVWSARVSLRGEDVEIDNIDDDDRPDMAPEILKWEGHSTVTSAGVEVKRDTTDTPLLPSRGSKTSGTWEYVGAFGGEFYFHRFSLSWDSYHTLNEDLLDRKTILALHADAGYITGGESPFFERFYAGNIGSVRGFAYRGISPRSGPDDDVIGGDFLLTGSVELTFPLYSDSLRGVLFVDAGTVEPDFGFGTIRTSAGAGVRLTVPALGQIPIALYLAVPINKDDEDQTQIFNFSLGSVQ